MPSPATSDQDELYQAVRYCKAHGVDAHVTINTMPRCNEVKELPAWLEVLDDAGVTAVIVADLGAFRLAQKYAPHVQKPYLHPGQHLQLRDRQRLVRLGCQPGHFGPRGAPGGHPARSVQKTPPELEIEAFVHGAMCVSYSGRCLLSNYMTGRDSSRGACAQPCRYQYYLMEEKRPGEYFPVFEDNKGTYIMNSRDMCMIDHVAELMDAGLNSLKIEGRAKSAYYAAIVTGAYRHAIDAAAQGIPLDPVWRDEVEKVSHRHYSTGFYYGYPGQFYEDSRYIRDWQVAAIVQDCTPDGLATLSLRNKFKAGDEVELVGPGCKPMAFAAPMMTDEEGNQLEEPKKPQMLFQMQLSQAVPPLSILRREVGLTP